MILHINGKLATYAQVRAQYPNTSFQARPDEATMRRLGHCVEPTPRPAGDVVTQGQPEQRDGQWYQTWEVRDYTEEELAEHLEQRRADKLQEINDAYQTELDAILNDYPNAETKTWDKQESEARAWDADNTSPTPLLDAVADGRNMDKAELVQRVLAKADAWIALSGKATGKRQRLEDEISSAATLDALDAIQW